jgi:hypothetical protein
MKAEGLSLADDRPSECQDCGALYDHQGDMEPIDNLFLRVAAGDPMPSGQCPNCGALCQFIPTTESREVR